MVRMDLTQAKDKVEFHGYAEVVTDFWSNTTSVTYTRKLIPDNS